VLAPKSTIDNWRREFNAFCPSLRVVVFHGDVATREEMKQQLLVPGVAPEDREWDVVLTTYEMANMEKTRLSKFAWEYLIVDEAHRLKNESSVLAGNIRDLVTAYRLLLTGTPLQNNLHELWALLNCLLPDVFSDSDTFDELFDLETGDAEAKQGVITQLHRILQPFMLRRLKVDTDKTLPPKSEVFLYVGLTPLQRNIYRSILKRDYDAILSLGDDPDKVGGAEEEKKDEDVGAADATGADRRRNRRRAAEAEAAAARVRRRRRKRRAQRWNGVGGGAGGRAGGAA
jgi:SWI/SNF-related matrix-associated actin-dependent regulator of chromatin subfamily A member 5